jgi:hypothetical protein
VDGLAFDVLHGAENMGKGLFLAGWELNAADYGDAVFETGDKVGKERGAIGHYEALLPLAALKIGLA